MTIYDFTLTDGKGNEVPLSKFKGEVMLIVNTATGCGFTITSRSKRCTQTSTTKASKSSTFRATSS